MAGINLKKLLKIPRLLGERPFFTLSMFLLLALALAGLLFYCVNVLPAKKSQASLQKPIQLEENVYQKVLETWGKREEKLKESEIKSYPDPFKVPAP